MVSQDDRNAFLESLPSPLAIHRRLGDVLREERLLRKLLRLSMAVHEELEKREKNDKGTK